MTDARLIFITQCKENATWVGGDTTHGDKREQEETKESWPSRSELEVGAELEGILFHKMHGPLGIV